MANFTNFTKLQLIVERTDLGLDGITGGNYIITIALVGTLTSDGDVVFLGETTAALQADTTTQVAAKMKAVFDLLTGVTSLVSGDSLVITYDDTATVPTLPEFPEVSNGVTGTYSAIDNRDTSIFLKHSEYEDSEAGLKLATEAMYSLVAASALTDATQLQRIKLSDSDATLITEDITLQVVGKNYKPYSV